MAPEIPETTHRVLIVSSHPLFSEGLRSLLHARAVPYELVGIVSTVEDAASVLESERPDIVIVDYDDEVVNRDAFMASFVGGEGEMRVVLLSLMEGKEGREAVIYDRRTMAASQMEEWLEGWAEPPSPPTPILESIPSPRRRGHMKHLIAAGVIVIIVAIGLGLVLTPENLLPAQASAQAVAIDNMFQFHFWAIAFLFSLIVVFMVYSMIAFRRRKGDTGDGDHLRGNTTLEVTWTLIPLGAVIGLAFWGSQVLADTQRIATDALEVNVIASQWNWRFEYPESGVISSELTLPKDRQALLNLRSLDVIHSFWVPEFRVKQDAIPVEEKLARELRVTPTQLGTFKLRCAELCGLQHTTMFADVRVLTPENFEAWIEEQQTAISDDPVIRGQTWANQYGCVACHSIDGSPGVGPTWLGVFDGTENLADGTTVPIDEAYLYESIRNPAAKIVEGFQNIMPANVASDMTDEQIADVIEFIKSLK